MIDVTCAIIRNGDKVLAVQRSHNMHLAGHWEFPGGKTETGETSEACIAREILEELNIRIRPVKQLIPVEHHYKDTTIRLIPFLCDIIEGEIELTEHAEYQWVRPDEIKTLKWAAADWKLIGVNELG